MTAILLLCVLLASFATWIVATALFLSGRRKQAYRFLLRWVAGAVVYLAIVLVAAATLPDGRIPQFPGPHCDDDWCLSVDGIVRQPVASGDVPYRLGVRIWSQAMRGVRSAKGGWLYLTDERGRRSYLTPDPTAAPFDITLQPGESVATSLTFSVPADARELYFNGGLDGIHYASFIIGNGDLLRRPRIHFRIQ